MNWFQIRIAVVLTMAVVYLVGSIICNIHSHANTAKA